MDPTANLTVNNALVKHVLTIDTIMKNTAAEVSVIGDFPVGAELLIDANDSSTASKIDI